MFLVCVLCAAWFFGTPTHPALPVAGLTASVAAFLVLVAVHGRARKSAARARALADLNRRGVARVRRDWASLPAATESVQPNHPYAVDLDVAGPSASLYRLLDVVSGATGRPTLMRWLLEPAPEIATIVTRQSAVSELARSIEFREELALLARNARDASPAQFGEFLLWAEGQPSLANATRLVWGARVIPVVTIGTSVLAFLRYLPWTAPALSLLVGIVLLGAHRTLISGGLTSVFAHGTGLRAQREMLELVGRTELVSPYLRELRDRTIGGAEALQALERTMALVEGQGSLMHAIMNTLFLWDVHALQRLDHWRARYGPRVRDCLESLGEVEALAALGMLAHDNPAWTFPQLDDASRSVTGTNVGHPLIAAATRVGNDVTVGPPGTLLLVTGSNMSGKSTLLRAIGLNVVLAQAGAPVCATQLTIPRLELRTSIRLADSLERGVSLFMAELERLKEIVDAARLAHRDRLVLYLLDEILHGTNTAERLIAARAVLGYLVHAGAIGAVTTHDLTLAADGELASASRPVHFTEQVSNDTDGGEPGMTFDYRLRPGIATSTNALKLLALVGLRGSDEADVTRPESRSSDRR